MELRHLRYFAAVADAEHFRRAAAALHVSQPTLSLQIQQLEKEVGATLFNRVGRGVRLTQAGLVLRDHVRRVLRELEHARAELNELAGLKTGLLSVGVVQTIGTILIPRVVATFAARYPGVILRIEELSSSGVEAGVAGGTLDLGISFVPVAAGTLDAEVLFEEELVLIVPPAHRWAARRKMPMADLAHEPLVLLSAAFWTRHIINEAFEAAGVTVRAAVEMNSITALVATVRYGKRPAILPRLAVAEVKSGLRAVRLEQPTPTRRIGLLLRKDRYPLRAREIFCEMVREQVVKLGLRR